VYVTKTSRVIAKVRHFDHDNNALAALVGREEVNTIKPNSRNIIRGPS